MEHFKDLLELNEVHINDKKTVEDLQGTDDFLYAMTPAMEKVFGKSNIKHNFRMEFPSILGKTVDGEEFAFGISINADTWKSLSYQVVLAGNGEMFVKDVAKMKDEDTVKNLNTRAISMKRDLVQYFEDIKTIPGSADDIADALKGDGFVEIG